MVAFEEGELLGSVVVVLETIVSVRLLDEKVMGRIAGDGGIERKVLLLDPRGRIGMLVVVGMVVGVPFVGVEQSNVLGGVEGDVDVGEVLGGVDEDILEEIVCVRGVHGRAEGGVVLERHCRRTTHHSSFVLCLQIPDWRPTLPGSDSQIGSAEISLRNIPVPGLGALHDNSPSSRKTPDQQLAKSVLDILFTLRTFFSSCA